MKYLKKFNESKFGTQKGKNSLKEFCNDYLANFLDEGFLLAIQTDEEANMTSGSYIITIGTKFPDVNSLLSGYLRDTENEFKWVDIKDSIIPFITVLSESYVIDEIYFDIKDTRENFNISVDDLISDNIDDVISSYDNYYRDLPKPLSECTLYKIEIIIE